MGNKVFLSNRAIKDLEKVPHYIRIAFQTWLEFVTKRGIREARKRRGYHDEALQGERFGQRSVRLSRSYRVIYKEDHNKPRDLEILVIEVNKHDY